MKKLTALILALAMALSMTAALAAGSASTTNKTTVTVPTTTEAAPLMWRIDLSDAAKALIEKLDQAKDGDGIASVFPEGTEISENATVADAFSVAVDPKIADETSYTAEILNVVGLLKGDTAQALAMVDDACFAASSVTVPEDNTLDMAFGQDVLKAMAGAADITIIVLVDKAE